MFVHRKGGKGVGKGEQSQRKVVRDITLAALQCLQLAIWLEEAA